MKRKPFKGERYIGGGAEGEVFQIDTHLVKKVWHHPLFQCSDVHDIVRRIKTVQQTVEKLPPSIKKWVRVPELAGYETDADGTPVTYHEYIKPNQSWPNSVERLVLNECTSRFSDFWVDKRGNVVFARGKFWLLDVVAYSWYDNDNNS